MITFPVISTIGLVAIFIWLVIIYNRFVRYDNQVKAAWSDIDVQLKRRHDLIPKLVDTVRQYASYEETVLERITTLRSEGIRLEQVRELGETEKQIEQQLSRIMMLAEDYPDLKASSNFLHLQQELSAVENALQYARRFYNGAVKLLNVQIDTFPDFLIARLFNYTYKDYFQQDMS